MLEERRVSARTPQMTVVSPVRTTALPCACDRLERLTVGVRFSFWLRPFDLEGEEVPSEGSRFARRYGWGESLANVARGRPISEAMARQKIHRMSRGISFSPSFDVEDTVLKMVVVVGRYVLVVDS
jgi:hypothetical protein